MSSIDDGDMFSVLVYGNLAGINQTRKAVTEMLMNLRHTHGTQDGSEPRKQKAQSHELG
jgi:hypothetical protein